MAFIIAFSVLGFMGIAAGMVLNKILKKEDSHGFIQELPPIRLPNLKAVLVKTYYRLYWFLKEALPVFIFAAVILFTIDKMGILDAAKKLFSPVINGFLGLPLQMVDALILSMARHESAAGMIIRLIDKGQLNYVQCIVALVMITMFVPCFANIMAIVKQLGIKRTIFMVIIINGSSFLIAGCLNWILMATIK
jgi:ferrous iron transport protein B